MTTDHYEEMSIMSSVGPASIHVTQLMVYRYQFPRFLTEFHLPAS